MKIKTKNEDLVDKCSSAKKKEDAMTQKKLEIKKLEVEQKKMSSQAKIMEKEIDRKKVEAEIQKLKQQQCMHLMIQKGKLATESQLINNRAEAKMKTRELEEERKMKASTDRIKDSRKKGGDERKST